MNNQLHITSEDVIAFDKLSNNNPEQYKQLLKFAENVQISRLKHRVNQFYTILALANDKKLTDFDEFVDLEVYVLENYSLLHLAASDITNINVRSFFEKNEELIVKLFNKFVPKLTGSNFDKIVSFLKKLQPRENVYHPFTFRNLLENLIIWYKNVQLYNIFDVHLEKFESLDAFNNAVARLNTFEVAHQLLKQLKPELTKNITNKADFYTKSCSLRENLKFYIPVIEQSHKYTDIDLFFKHMKEMEIKLQVKEVFDILEKEKIKLIHYDSNTLEVAIHVENFKQIEKIGSRSWCLTNHLSDWMRYTENAYFIIYWKFFKEEHYSSKHQNKDYEMYGICLDKKDLKHVYCQSKFNNACKVDFSDEINLTIKQFFNDFKTKELKTNKLDPFSDNLQDVIITRKPGRIPEYTVAIQPGYAPKKSKNIFTKLFN